jgi:hypothetical protein
MSGTLSARAENTFLTPMLEPGRILLGIEGGYLADRLQESRGYERYVLDYASARVLPLNFQKETDDRYVKWRAAPLIRVGVADGWLLHARGGLYSTPDYSLDVGLYSRPAANPAGRLVTVDYRGATDDESSRQKADCDAGLVMSVGSNAQVLLDYRFRKDFSRSRWKYRVRSNDTAGTLVADRLNWYEFENDDRLHEISLGVKYLTDAPFRPPSLGWPDLDLLEKPLLFPAAVYLHLTGGERFVHDYQARHFRFMDTTWVSLQLIGPGEALFFQEEDYSCNPRMVVDDYHQFFLEWEGMAGLTRYSMVELRGRYNTPATWTREIDREDGPHVFNFQPGTNVRTYKDEQDKGAKRSWNAEFKLVYRPDRYMEFSLSHVIRGRRARYENVFTANQSPLVNFPTDNYNRWVDDVREDVSETRIGLIALTVAPEPTPASLLDYLAVPLIAAGQAMIAPYVGFRKVAYDKEMFFYNDSWYPTSGGVDTIRLDMGYDQWFLGMKAEAGLMRGVMLAVEARWDLPADYRRYSPYSWDYRPGGPTDWSDRSGLANGETTATSIGTELVYRMDQSVQLQFKLGYSRSRTVSDWHWGPSVMPAGPWPVQFFDEWNIEKKDEEITALLTAYALY